MNKFNQRSCRSERSPGEILNYLNWKHIFLYMAVCIYTSTILRTFTITRIHVYMYTVCICIHHTYYISEK